MKDIVLVGFGGHAKSVADCIEREGKYHIVGYTDLQPQQTIYPYLGTDDELPTLFKNGIRNAVVCIGYLGKGDIREILYDKLKRVGFHLPVIVDPSSIISKDVKMGEGSFIGKGTIINTEARIGKMCIINTKALIEHECIIEDYEHVAVGAVLCGQVTVGKAAFIGANATIIQQRTISERTIVPAGVVIR